jgi:uncharacterized SAM-binding protein YcdF (DUF218 family)
MSLQPILLPPGGLFTFAALLFLAARLLRVRARWPALISVAVAYLASTPLVGETALSWHQTAPPLPAQALQPADAGGPGAVVILSAGLRTHTQGAGQPRLDSLSTTRLLYGAELAERTDLPVLVTGGVWAGTGRRIGAEMAAFLRRWSDAEVRWTEARARDTWDNAHQSARLLQDAGIGRIYLVTHAWHMPRATYAFRAHGIEVVPAPTGFIGTPQLTARSLIPAPEGVQAAYWALHELLGRLAYRWFKSAPAAADTR